jgi:hypothetical protein
MTNGLPASDEDACLPPKDAGTSWIIVMGAPQLLADSIFLRLSGSSVKFNSRFRVQPYGSLSPPSERDRGPVVAKAVANMNALAKVPAEIFVSSGEQGRVERGQNNLGGRNGRFKSVVCVQVIRKNVLYSPRSGILSLFPARQRG